MDPNFTKAVGEVAEAPSLALHALAVGFRVAGMKAQETYGEDYPDALRQFLDDSLAAATDYVHRTTTAFGIE